MENRKQNLNLLLAFAITTYPTFYAVNIFVECVGYYFSNLPTFIGPILIYITPLILFFFYLKNQFINKSTKIGKIIFISILSLIILLGLVFFFLRINVFIRNYKYHLINYLFPFDFILIIIVDIFFIIKIIKSLNEEREIVKHKFLFYVGAGLLFFVLILVEFFMYESSFFVHFFDTLPLKQILILLIIELCCMAPAVGLYFNFRTDTTKDTKLLRLIFSIIPLFVLLELHTMQIINPNIFVMIGKPYFELDFYSSLSLGPIFLSITNITPMICYLIRNRKMRTSEN